MQAFAVDHALNYFTIPKQQLVIWAVEGLTISKFKFPLLPMHGFSLSSCKYIWI
jgi:hypothetical protein